MLEKDNPQYLLNLVPNDINNFNIMRNGNSSVRVGTSQKTLIAKKVLKGLF